MGLVSVPLPSESPTLAKYSERRKARQKEADEYAAKVDAEARQQLEESASEEKWRRDVERRKEELTRVSTAAPPGLPRADKLVSAPAARQARADYSGGPAGGPPAERQVRTATMPGGGR